MVGIQDKGLGYSFVKLVSIRGMDELRFLHKSRVLQVS